MNESTVASMKSPSTKPAQEPIGQGHHVVKPQDCMSSIAFEHGFFWETLWNHPKNGHLKEQRGEPNTLNPDDRVFIPEKRIRQEDGVTEKRHVFRRKGIPVRLNLRFLREGKPLSGERYKVSIDGKWMEGLLDEEGVLDVPIPASARNGKVRIGSSRPVEYNVDLGALNPIDCATGVQQRLQNLKLYSGKIDGVIGKKTSAAIKAFQSGENLPRTGNLDDTTREHIHRYHRG